MKKLNSKLIVISGMLVAVALTLSVAEKIFPIGALIPVPGIKLGLANVVTMMALFYMGSGGALAILITRCLLGGLFSGVSSMMFSLAGGLFAYTGMLIMKQMYGKVFSIYGVSMAGAALHNLGQILMASLLLGTSLLHTYLPLLLFTGLATGVLTATVAGPIFARLESAGLIARYFPSGRRYFSKNS